MNLQVLKPGQSGKGILIEYDAGFINPRETQNQYIMENKVQMDHSKPFEFYAVLQKYDTPNRNGRTYPERILKREAENYKKMIEFTYDQSELKKKTKEEINNETKTRIIRNKFLQIHQNGGILGKVHIINMIADILALHNKKPLEE